MADDKKLNPLTEFFQAGRLMLAVPVSESSIANSSREALHATNGRGTCGCRGRAGQYVRHEL